MVVWLNTISIIDDSHTAFFGLTHFHAKRLKESLAKYTSFFAERVAFRGKILQIFGTDETFATSLEGTTNQEWKYSDSQLILTS